MAKKLDKYNALEDENLKFYLEMKTGRSKFQYWLLGIFLGIPAALIIIAGMIGLVFNTNFGGYALAVVLLSGLFYAAYRCLK